MGERRGEPGGMGEPQRGRGEGDLLIFKGAGEGDLFLFKAHGDGERLKGDGEGVLAGESLGDVAGVERGDSSSIS